MSWFSRLKNALNPRQLDEDLTDEMADHLARRTAALGEKGLNPGEAQRQACVRFGNSSRLREESREFRLWAGLEGTLQDLRYAWRGMRKGPIFAASAVISLALAIGANTAIYSIVDAAILRPLPVYEPNRLFTLSWPGISDPGGPPDRERQSFSYPEFLQYSAVTKPVARMALFSYPLRVEAQGANPDAPIEKVNKSFTSGEGFDVLGVRPAVGRLFTTEEDRIPQGRAVAVLSCEYWRRRFQTDPAIVGRTLKIEGTAYQIIGVAQKGFFGVEPGRFVDVWLPGTLFDSNCLASTGCSWFCIVGRLASGASPQQVQARLQPSFHEFQIGRVKEFPTIPPVIRKQFLESVIRVHSARAGVSNFRQIFSSPLWIVFGVAAGLLFIACANVASLLLARSTARAAEMAMRVSLGAARIRLVRQMLTESLLLSSVAGGLGWLLARIAGPSLARMLSLGGDPVQLVLALDTRVLFFCIGVSTASALFFGLLPAWQASAVQPMLSLRTYSGQAGKLRLGKVFVGFQVACALCLVLVGAAFLFSLRNLLHVNPGFDPRNVAVLNVSTEAGKQSEEAQRGLMRELRSRVSSQRDVAAAALAMWPFFTGGGWSEQVIVPGKGPSEQEEVFYRVSPGYFAALKTRLVSGRDFEARDSGTHALSPVIVNEAFARKYFDRLDVLGQEFTYGKSLHREVIVGVASDANYWDLRKGADPMVYLPEEGSHSFTLYIRSPLKLGSLTRIVEREARAVGSGMRVREVTSLEAIVGNTLIREKVLAAVAGTLAFFGLLLVAIGLFGLLSYSVGRRTKEIGIRTALGAQRSEIISLVLKEVSGLMGVGVVVGVAAALAVMTLFKSLLFGVQGVDPLVIGTALGLFLLAGLLAASLPARRAATIDPVSALREE